MSADYTQPIVFNGLTCAPLTPPAGGGPVSGCVIRTIDMSPIAVDVQTTKRPLSDGSALSDAYLSGRPVNIAGEVWGSSVADLWDRWELWAKAFSPRSPSLLTTAPLTFYQPTGDTATWNTGYIPLYLTCAPIREPWHAAPRRDDFDPSAHVMDVYAELYAADPYKYVNSARISQTLTTASVATAYRGDAPCASIDAWVYLTGTGPSSVTLEIDSAYGRPDLGYSLVQLDLSSLSTGHVWVLSFSEKTMKYGTVQAGVIGSSSIFGAMTKNATAKMTVNTGDAANISYIKLLCNEAFF